MTTRASPAPDIEMDARGDFLEHFVVDPALGIEDSPLAASKAVRDHVAGLQQFENVADRRMRASNVHHHRQSRRISRLVGAA